MTPSALRCGQAPIRFARAALVLGILMTLSTPAFSSYRTRAEEASAAIQRLFYDPKEGLYRPAYPMREGDNPYDYMWGNGVQFTSLAAAAQYDPAAYRPVLDTFAKGLRRYWQASAPIPGFDAYWSSVDAEDKYYDDNAWLVLGFVEAYQATKDVAYLDWARETQDFVESGWDNVLGGGIYWHQNHQSKNTCSNAPAAAAALRLYQVGRTKEDKAQLDWALRIRHWLNATLKDTDGLYWDNINLKGEIEKTKWTYNTALMIRTDVLLYEATKVKPYLAEARRMADASIDRWVDPETGYIQDPPRFSHLLAESLLRLYDATREPKYLNVVRRHADYVYRHGRDPEGGYYDSAKKEHHPGERKLLIENASTARLFWLLAPYPDVNELLAAARARIDDREFSRAEPLLRQAVETAPDSLEARYRYWWVLNRRKKTEEAEREAARLAEWAKDPEKRIQLQVYGWTPENDGDGASRV